MELNETIYSKTVEKLSRALNDSKQKARITKDSRMVIYTYYEWWENGTIVVSGKNRKEDLCQFIYKYLSLAGETNVNKPLSISRIKSIIREF